MKNNEIDCLFHFEMEYMYWPQSLCNIIPGLCNFYYNLYWQNKQQSDQSKYRQQMVFQTVMVHVPLFLEEYLIGTPGHM